MGGAAGNAAPPYADVAGAYFTSIVDTLKAGSVIVSDVPLTGVVWTSTG